LGYRSHLGHEHESRRRDFKSAHQWRELRLEMYSNADHDATWARQPQSLPGRLKIVLTIGLLSVSSLIAGQLSGDLQKLPPGAAVTIIVQFKNPPAAVDLAAITQLGGTLKRTFPNIRAGLFTVPAAALRGIAANPNVTYISPDRRLAGSLEFAEPTVGANIALQYGWNGTGVGVAVIDSGIDPDHPDLKPRVVYSQSFVPGDSGTNDVFGHGTHVAGIVGGNGTASTGPNYVYTFRGIAPKANLINLRALDSNGQGTDSTVISAIDQAIALKSAHNIRVLNLSLGRTIQESYTLDPLCQEVQKAWEAGLVVVVAAGNNGRDNSMGASGYGTITSPANSPYAITVGTMKDMGTMARGDDLIASYSSKGPTLLDHVVKPDLVAPGNNIASALASYGSVLAQLYPGNIVPVSYYKANGNGPAAYLHLSGTSMATPMVSGAAALLLQQQPSLTPDQVKARLMKTATKNFPATSVAVDPVTGISYTSTYDLFTVGAGHLDVWAALNNTDVASGPALSPTASYDSTTGNTSVVIAPGSVWQNAIIWGTGIVWGSNVIVNGTAVIWGTAIIWGTNTTSGFAIIWGTNVVWDASQPFLQTVSIYGDQ
jgi:serine protease AprX